MASNAQKLVYTLKAVYEGDGELKKLDADLKALARIEAHKDIEEGWKKTAAQFNAAKAEMRSLKKEMKSSDDPKLAKQYAKAAADVKKYGKALDEQKKKLDKSREALKSQEVALSNLDSEYDNLNTAVNKHGRELAALRTLGVRAFSDIDRQVEGLEKAYKDLAKSGRYSKRELGSFHREMKNQIADLRTQTNGWREQVGRVREGWAGLATVAVSGVAFGAMVERAGESEKALKNLADVAGMTVGEFQAYAIAAKSVGVEQDKLADMSKDIKDKIGDYMETGGGEAADFFKNVADKAGLAADELQRMSGPDALIAVKKAMDDVGISAENQKFYLESFANDASLLIPLLEKEGRALKEKAEVAKELTKSLSDIDRENILKVNESIEEMKIAFGTMGKEIVAALSPAIIGLMEGVTDLVTAFNEMPDSMKQVALGGAALATAFIAWESGVKHLWTALKIGKSVLLDYGGAARKTGVDVDTLSGKMGRLGKLSKLSKFGLGGAALVGGFAIGKAISDWEYLNDVVKANKDALDEVPEKFRAITEATGVTIRSFDDLDDAQKKGLIAYDDMVGKWVKGAGKMAGAYDEVSDAAKDSANKQVQLSAQALKQMQQQYKKYADEVKRLQDELDSREMSGYEELREMDRSVMSEGEAWRDRKQQAEEYITVARAAAEAGDHETAIEYADRAKDLYKQLNTEVKEGNQVIIDQGRAFKIARAGVEESLKISTEGIKAQQDAYVELMDTMAEKANFEDLANGMDDVMRQWLVNWKNMRESTEQELDQVEERIERIVKDETKNIYVNIIEKKKSGGLAGAMQFAQGGSPAQVFQRLAAPLVTRGSGQRDDVPALLTKHEFVQPEPAVRYYGVNFMEAIRRLQFPRDLVQGFNIGGLVNSLALPSPVSMQTGGLAVAAAGGDTYNLNFNISGSLPQANQQNARELADMVMRELQRRHKGSSR